jgi:hypothetical protein
MSWCTTEYTRDKILVLEQRTSDQQKVNFLRSLWPFWTSTSRSTTHLGVSYRIIDEIDPFTHSGHFHALRSIVTPPLQCEYEVIRDVSHWRQRPFSSRNVWAILGVVAQQDGLPEYEETARGPNSSTPRGRNVILPQRGAMLGQEKPLIFVLLEKRRACACGGVRPGHRAE